MYIRCSTLHSALLNKACCTPPTFQKQQQQEAEATMQRQQQRQPQQHMRTRAQWQPAQQPAQQPLLLMTRGGGPLVARSHATSHPLPPPVWAVLQRSCSNHYPGSAPRCPPGTRQWTNGEARLGLRTPGCGLNDRLATPKLGVKMEGP